MWSMTRCFYSFFFSTCSQRLSKYYNWYYLILYDNHTYFLPNARGNMLLERHTNDTSPLSLFSGRIISLKLDSRVRRRQYMLRLRIWSPRVIAPSPGKPAKLCPSIFLFYSGVKCVETHNSAAEAYKNIDRARSGAAASAKESSKNYRARVLLYMQQSYNSENLVNRKVLGSRSIRCNQNITCETHYNATIF